jgi:WD40 repeat protein
LAKFLHQIAAHFLSLQKFSTMKRIILVSIIIIAVTLPLASQNIRLVPPVGHTAQITDVDISDDGRYIVSSSVDKTVIVWDYATGREIVKFAGTDYGVVSCVFSKNMDKVYSAGWDGKVREWSLETFDQTACWDGFSNGINELAVYPDVKKVAILGNAGILKIINTKDGSVDKEIKVSKVACYGLAISSKGKILATGDFEGNLKIFNAKDLSLLNEIKANEFQIKAICISPDETMLATSSYDYKIKIFDIKTGKLLMEYTDEYQMWSSSDFSPDSKKLASVTLNGLLYEWDVETGTQNFKVQSKSPMATAVKYKNDGKEIVVCGASNEISVFRSIEGTHVKTFMGSTSPIESLDAYGEKFMLASAHWDSRVRIFNMFKCKLQSVAFPDNSFLSGVHLSKNSKEAVISSMRPGIHIFNYLKSELNILINSTSGINSMAFSLNEDYYATAGNDSVVTIFSSADNTVYASYKHKGDVMDVCFSADGKYVFSVGRDSQLYIYSVGTKAVLRIIKDLGSKAESVAVSADGIHVAAGLWTGEIVIVNITNGEIVKKLKPHNWIVSDLEFSPISDYLCSVSWDKKVCITDWQNSEPIAEYKGHTGSVISCAYSDDGRYISTGGWDNQIKILDSRNLEEICTVIPVGKEDYLITTPEMYYMGTPDAARKVSFAVGMFTYSFDQFDLQYNRPDKVIEMLPFADQSMVPIYRKAYEKRLEKTGFNIDFFDNKINAPQIFIKNMDNIKLFTDSEFAELEIAAFDTIYFIDRYNVYVNGVAVFGSNGKNVRKSDQKTISIKEKVGLSQGLNKIEVSCINSAGVESLRNSVEIFYNPSEGIKPNVYVISMAVAEYENPQYNLNYTINDGREIISVFSELEPEYNIIVDSLFGANCTRENFLALQEKLKNTKVDDIVIVHFSGHGLLDSNGDFYFATYGIDFNNPAAKGLEYNLIEGIIDGIPARNKLVLLDACHSGELDYMPEVDNGNTNEKTEDAKISGQAQSALAARGVVMYSVPGSESSDDLENSYDVMTEYFADVRKGTGSVVISAATGTGFALEIGDLEHGIFTYCLLKGLREGEADFSGDGKITVSELREYIFTNVEKLSEGYQKPTARKDNLVNDFVIYR